MRSFVTAMENKVRIGVRYCGGCNPRYDRVGMFRRLADMLPEAEFVLARDAESLCAAIVICGCAACCADTGDLPVEVDCVYMKSAEDFESAREKLAQIVSRKRD